MAKVIARVSGVALKPGISRNRRLYTKTAIARMVADAHDRIESGNMPLTDQTPEPISQLTHHQAGDDSTRLIGRVTSLSLDGEGNARFTADIADTPHGRTIASLLDTSDGQPPFLRNVSIRGAWNGPTRQILGGDGEPVTTGDAVSLNGIDYTGTPGVPGAQVDGFEWATPAAYPHPGETADGRVLIYESVTEALVTVITEETSPAEVTPAPQPGASESPPGPAETAAAEARAALSAMLPGGSPVVLRNGIVSEASVPMSKRDSGLAGAGKVWADPGYQADKKQRYDLSTKDNAKAAWSYIHQADNAKAYTAAQLKRVKGRIIKALKKFGVTVATEGWTIEPAFQVSESLTEFMGGDPSRAGSWSVCASNGPVTLNLSSYCMDPADLDVILRAAADAACKALAALDPDMDGDVDVPGVGPNSDTDGDAGETVPAPPPSPVPAPRETTAPPAVSEAADTEPDEDPAEESAADNPATIPAAAPQKEEESAMSETAPQETAAGQAPAATSTPAPAVATLTMDRATLESMLAEAVAAGREQGKKERKAELAAQAAAAAAAAAAPAAPAPPAETAAAAPAAPAPAAAVPAAPAVAEASEEDTARLVREGVAALLAADGITVPAQETREQQITRLVQEEYTRVKQQMVADGRVVVERKGLSADGEVNEHRTPPAVPGTEAAQGVHPLTGFPTTWPGGGAKQPHEWTSEELTKFGGATLDHYVMGSRAVTELP